MNDNVFRKPGGPFIHASCVRSLEVQNNRLICADGAVAEIQADTCQVCDRDNEVVVHA